MDKEEQWDLDRDLVNTALNRPSHELKRLLDAGANANALFRHGLTPCTSQPNYLMSSPARSSSRPAPM